MKTKTKYCIFIGLLTNRNKAIAKNDVIMEVSEVLSDFSVIKQTGYWSGVKEKSLCITYIGEKETVITMEKLAKHLQKTFEQDAVYLTQEQITLFNINSEYVPRETHNSRV